ncbi:cytochrome c oxidase cbb3-type subunit 4 [Salinihabitans flavidus]|uniref:Cytochrome c oxidase cbb3-type subunit 4 n=1 Tax=Salinihabitans flavidus TaxID=569882 RepID=A0A1H8V544_9RHOB|nr:cbb3-type cytochrome c oxidase subunit 3 [Salinihabitans flavidus]SEP10590.1 cytochrome c oxidase cbb3-type subunit 4 [Salinihabitans flavidus]
METYSLLRQFADSWMLLFLFLFFIAVIIWVFRPGSRKTHQDSADIPFRHEHKPASDDDDDEEARKSKPATDEEARK